jgi:nitrate reductase assembly molybdenum cofactor insertion protein NarJ
MTTIQPEGENLRKAVKWISAEHQYNPARKRASLIEEACLKFDLTPMDAEYLYKFDLKQNQKIK